ncbi:PREDICTED: E3 ubiquitin-protein ligase ATL23-like [Nicotiana attenuata]|uniref:E3 ubiquitin-protein ligase atl23 n=1 Tax=Nicotiana attenuata TaxID=49451 RepID=A0A314LAT4_NICAT|nr:PREDICTED: E3 ubiquitin-protein ligase ATL23-like [Nicotiana attenuata]OIT38716.1 e3 ubiquitin-protein ligase atl23 [Nicotiana attenuata]
MLFAVFLALFLPCVGMSVVFVVYMCFLCYATTNNSSGRNNNNQELADTKPPKEKGLSSAQLDKLPKVTGQELVLGNDCAVCLDIIESEQLARLVPGCNHGFHLECADTWLSKHSVCPVCRSKLETELFNPPQSNPC